MATVPGSPTDDGGIPKELQPTQGDLLMAAAIMHQQGKFRVAGDVLPFPQPSKEFREGQRMMRDVSASHATKATLDRVLGGTQQNVLPITPKSGD